MKTKNTVKDWVLIGIIAASVIVLGVCAGIVLHHKLASNSETSSEEEFTPGDMSNLPTPQDFEGEEPPELTDGEMPDFDGEEPPELPEGEAPNEENPRSNSEGEPSGSRPARRGQTPSAESSQSAVE